MIKRQTNDKKTNQIRKCRILLSGTSVIFFGVCIIISFIITGCNSIPETTAPPAKSTGTTQMPASAPVPDEDDNSSDIAMQEETDNNQDDKNAAPEQPLAWKQLYLDYLQDNYAGDEHIDGYLFYLLYIDDDNVPELFFYNPDYRGSVLCTVFENELFTDDIDYMYYIERGNLILFSSGQMDEYYDAICAIENGKIVTLHRGYYIGEFAGFDEEEPYEFNYFSWDDFEVESEADYFRLRDEYFDMSQATDYLSNGVSLNEIIQRINEH